MDFKKKYPLSAREASYTPMIIRDGLLPDRSLPYPCLKGIRDFTAYCGFSDSAIRTTLSRAHAEGAIRVFRDAAGVTRYQMTESQMEMGKTASGRRNQPEGFIVAVFSFTAGEETGRVKVRETLKYYGFKKLAQNTYINGRIETSGLKKAMREFGLEKNLYLFHCPNVDDKELVDKILSVFSVADRNKFLKKFYGDLVAFLAEKDLDQDEMAHRIAYAGPVHWTICFVDEPPFPRKYLPKDYPLDSIISFYVDFAGRHMKDFIAHYVRLNG